MPIKLEHIFFDLDGPILEVSGRYFYVHKQICRILGIKLKVNRKIYWESKRRGLRLEDILGVNDIALISRYKKLWLDNIEKKDALLKDRVFPYAYKVLDYLAKKYRLSLVTLRKNHQGLKEELKKLKLAKYFNDIIVVRHKHGHIAKYKGIIRKYPKFAKAIFIGDTEIDIKAAKLLGIPSVAVLSGIRGLSYLKKFKPEYIIRDIRELKTRMII